jgi:putative RecB family exonuclease
MNEKAFVNKHLSYSRLTRFEQCPASFKLHYVDKQTAEPGVALLFGKLIHGVLEVLVREHMEAERTGVLSEERAIELYRDGWAKAGLTGMDVFQEGLDIIRSFISDQGEVDHKDVLAIEQEFHLPVGRFTVLGYIDRVDWVDDETVEVIDYKTNRLLFTREEVDANLQMSLYHLAAKQIWPWVKNVRLTFHMLRHGIRMRTERTEAELQDAKTYVETLGEMTESATEFPARLNPNCIYCDHRSQCATYTDALQGKRDFICENLTDLEAVAKEREEVSRLAKVLYSRKQALEKVIKTHLDEHEELILGGVSYRMYNTTKLIHPLDATIEVLGKVTGMPWDELVRKLTVVDNKALDQVLKKSGLDKARIRLLKAELETTAKKSFSPRLWAKEVPV